jgi:hypothetical protein
MTMNVCPSWASPISWIEQMFLCSKAEAAFASWTKRAFSSAD